MNVLFELEPGAIEPTKAHPEDAGWDLYLPPMSNWSDAIREGEEYIFNTKVHILIPPGYVGLVLPRSGVSAKGIHVAIGVIDAGYTGPIKITAWAISPYGQSRPYLFSDGDRIAQLVVLPLPAVELIPGKVIGVETSRGAGGFGSTGR